MAEGSAALGPAESLRSVAADTARIVILNADSAHTCAQIKDPRHALERSRAFREFAASYPVALLDVGDPAALAYVLPYDVIGHEAWVLVFDESRQLIGSFSADEVGGACTGQGNERFGARIRSGIEATLGGKSTPIEVSEAAWAERSDRESFRTLYRRYEEFGLEVRGKRLVRKVRGRSDESIMAADAQFLFLREELARIAAFESGQDPTEVLSEFALAVAASPASPFYAGTADLVLRVLVGEFDLRAWRLKLEEQLAEGQRLMAASDDPLVQSRARELLAEIDDRIASFATDEANEYRVVPLGIADEALVVLAKIRPLYRNEARLDRLTVSAKRALGQ